MEEVDLNAIGYRIQQQRNNLGLTQQYMCDKLDITQNHYSRIENGHVGMSFNILLQLSQILKISTDYILTGNIENIDELYFDVNYNNLTSKQKEYINRQIQLLAEFDLK
jgi:transcriptional regulator with XRE-family HTH domain